MRLDEPQPLVNAARYFGEQIGRIEVAQIVGFVDGLTCRLAERGQGRRKGVDVAPAINGRCRVFTQRCSALRRYVQSRVATPPNCTARSAISSTYSPTAE